jgi:hypothetical protein
LAIVALCATTITNAAAEPAFTGIYPDLVSRIDQSQLKIAVETGQFSVAPDPHNIVAPRFKQDCYNLNPNMDHPEVSPTPGSAVGYTFPVPFCPCEMAK